MSIGIALFMKIVIIFTFCKACIIGRIYINAIDFSFVFILQKREGIQIFPLD